MQIVHVDSVNSVTSEAKEPLTLADEMASFEYIDELAASTVTSYSSFSDFGKNYTTNIPIIHVNTKYDSETYSDRTFRAKVVTEY